MTISKILKFACFAVYMAMILKFIAQFGMIYPAYTVDKSLVFSAMIILAVPFILGYLTGITEE